MILLPVSLLAKDHEDRKLFFLNLSKLEFEAAKKDAALETNSKIRFEMLQLVKILFYEGQIERRYFKLSEDKPSGTRDIELSFIRALNAGYINLFYDRGKGNAYKYFYQAYQLAKELDDPILIKASLLAFFKYYNFEIVQVSDSYKSHIEQFESLKEDYIDEVWLTLYKMIFYSKASSLGKLNNNYYKLGESLDDYEKRLNPQSPVLAHVFYEKAIKFEIQQDVENCVNYYKKVIEQAKEYPFLKDERFFSYVKLVNLEAERKNFLIAKGYLEKARKEVNLADTLRSDYYLNLYGSHFYRAQNKNDSAFILFKRAYLQEFQLDFRRNTLEVNRLNVELETQEKENANLRLRQSRTWLISSLVGVVLLFLASYFAYTNQRTKNRVQTQQAEVKIEKLLKEQEQIGINAMLDGQDKERQRIANELHDNLGSLLTTLKFHFHALRDQKLNTDAQSDQLLEKTDQLLDEAYQQARTIAHMKNAGVSAQEGLLPAVKNFAIEVNEHGMDKRLDNTFEITIFRIIQELIANIVKHAKASTAIINLTQHEESINIMVEDNGVGFDIAEIKPSMGMGLHSIQKRVESMGGNVTIESIPKNGTTVIIDLPII
jgi:signal transduction histidine kinase